MILDRIRPTVLASCALALLCSVPAHAESWAGESFLSDYSKLQPVQEKQGKNYLYIKPGAEARGTKINSVMLDEPEVFISAESPYKGAKPEDIAAISGLIRETFAAALKERGYAIVDKPGENVVYIQLAVTNLQIAKKKRGLLAYTPVGFVVSAGVSAMKDFLGKYDLLDLSLQGEVQDSTNGEVLAAAVLQRGKGAGTDKRLDFDVLVSAVDLYADRFACSLDNAHVPAAQRIDCADPVAREARPKVVGK